MTCPYYDCGYCYSPPDRNTSAQQGGCYRPGECPVGQSPWEFREGFFISYPRYTIALSVNT